MNLIAGIILWFAFFTGTILIAKENPFMMWDIPSLLIILGFDISALIVSGGAADFLRGMKQLIKQNTVLTRDQLVDAADVFNLMNRCSISGGFIGSIMGLIMMLVNLQQPGQIGPYLAVSLLTLLYGLSLSIIILMPGRSRLLKLGRSL